MKPTAKPPIDTLPPLLAFGAHPDDIEFGCGGIIANEILTGRRAHFVICSRGESATHGTPAIRSAEARDAAAILGATVEFVELDGDAHLDPKPAHAIKLAAIIRRERPGFVFAPSLVENQHPDHPRLGRLVRDAARLARYGGVAKLRASPAHTIGPLLYYVISQEAEPAGVLPLLMDVSDLKVIGIWTKAMEAHASQLRSRDYVELQLSRARVQGLRAGVEYAQALYSNDPLVFGSLAQLIRSARRF
jgi:N-acetylglucosamine malate deacetylase 1